MFLRILDDLGRELDALTVQRVQGVGDICVYDANTISVLMHPHRRTDYYVCVCVCVCVCAYMREDDGWIRVSSLNTSTVVYD